MANEEEEMEVDDDDEDVSDHPSQQSNCRQSQVSDKNIFKNGPMGEKEDVPAAKRNVFAGGHIAADTRSQASHENDRSEGTACFKSHGDDIRSAGNSQQNEVD